MVTAMEGNKMVKERARRAALATAAIGSFVAGTIATVIVTLFAPLVAGIRGEAGARRILHADGAGVHHGERRAGQSSLRGLTALFIGLAVGWWAGPDLGQMRYTGGVPELLDGIEIVLVAVGLFAVAEALHTRCSRAGWSSPEPHEPVSRWRARTGAVPCRPGCAAPAIGAPFGCIPAGGTEIPTFLSYATEKRRNPSDRPSSVRRGAIEGVAGPGREQRHGDGALIPLLTLGIPTSNTTAIMLGAFQNYGIQPGPQLFSSSARWSGR